jgi:hypothetical protein
MKQWRKWKVRISASTGLLVLLIAVSTVAPTATFAQTDEIQVYDASIAPQGVFNIMWHNNYTPDGARTPAYPGAIISDKSYNSVPEWAYGVTPWFEQGLYLPIYSVSKGHGSSLDGFKLRELFVRPHAEEHTFFYGINFEFSYNATYWEPTRASGEIRPIIGWHLHPWDIIVNPIVDTDYRGGFKNLRFVPSERVAYNFNSRWAGAVEEYAEYGPLRGFYGTSGQTHQLWAVMDHTSKIVNIETGVGFGLTKASDSVTLKLMFSRDINSKPWPAKRKQSPTD